MKGLIISQRTRLVLSAAAALLLLVSTALNAAVPRPEHPRPDAFRENWLSLNGEWQFEVDNQNDGQARGLVSGTELSGKILVPFCPESKLSGIGSGNDTFMKYVWYRRTVEAAPANEGQAGPPAFWRRGLQNLGLY